MYTTQNGWTKERMKQHLLTNMLDHRSQDYTSTNAPGCAYRAADGNKCGVGCFIPESKYTAEMEGNNAIHVIDNFGLHQFMPLDKFGMMQLQKQHDEWEPNSASLDPRPDIIRWIDENVHDDTSELDLTPPRDSAWSPGGEP